MKKLSFKNLNLKVDDLLQSKELKTIYGGASFSCSVNSNCSTGCLSTYHNSGQTVCSTCCTSY